MKKSFWIAPCVVIIILLVIFSNSSYNPRIILADRLMSKGNFYYNGGSYDLEKAEKYFRWSLYIDPKISYAHYQLARIYLVKSYLDEAKKEIDTELKLHPENKRSFYVRGLIDGYSKNYDGAINDFSQFIDYAPNEWPGYMDLSWVYINNGKYQEAVDTTTEGLKSNPDQVWLLSNEGLALYKLKNFEEAKGVLEKDKESAKKITPEDWKVAYPGNDPAGAEEGVRDVKAAISYNLALVYKNLNETGKYLDEVDYYRSLFPAGDPKIEKIYDTL